MRKQMKEPREKRTRTRKTVAANAVSALRCVVSQMLTLYSCADFLDLCSVLSVHLSDDPSLGNSNSLHLGPQFPAIHSSLHQLSKMLLMYRLIVMSDASTPWPSMRNRPKFPRSHLGRNV